MTLRGLISPPRSRSSPRESRPHNNNAAGNPPSKPMYVSPCRRPTVVNPNEQGSQRKENHTTTVKASAIRVGKNNHAGNSPPRNRSSPKPSRPSRNASGSGNPRIDASKPTAPIVSSRRPTAAPNPNDLQSQKKLDHNHSGCKTTAKTSYPANSSRPSSPRTISVQQRLRRNNGVEPPSPTTTVKPSQPRGATHPKNNTVKGAIASASRSDVPGASNIAASVVAKDSGNLISQKYFDSRNNSPKHLPSHGGHQQAVNISNVGNQNPYSGGHHTTLGDPDVHNQLQQLSIDGKDLANIVLHANSIYESVGSDTKEECSSQTDAPRIFQIYKDIASHRQGNFSITSYFTKLKALWDELASYSDLPQCSCGAMEKLSEHGEREKVMQFLLGLDDSYSTICAQILLLRPFPTVEKAYYVIIREEKRRELVFSLEIVAAKVMQNKWLFQNDQSSSQANEYSLLSNGDDPIEVDNNLQEQQVDQSESGTTTPASIYNPDVEVPSFPHEQLLIDLGSPVRC